LGVVVAVGDRHRVRAIAVTLLFDEFVDGGHTMIVPRIPCSIDRRGTIQ
jgi:hypothetical protein